jgi:hypothetical protein
MPETTNLGSTMALCIPRTAECLERFAVDLRRRRRPAGNPPGFVVEFLAF